MTPITVRGPGRGFRMIGGSCHRPAFGDRDRSGAFAPRVCSSFWRGAYGREDAKDTVPVPRRCIEGGVRLPLALPVGRGFCAVGPRIVPEVRPLISRGPARS